jgi:hypothetical protein
MAYNALLVKQTLGIAMLARPGIKRPLAAFRISTRANGVFSLKKQNASEAIGSILKLGYRHD